MADDAALSVQQLNNMANILALDQEDLESPQLKKEQVDPCSSWSAERLTLKQESETFESSPTFELLDQETPYIKEEQEELSSSLDGDLVIIKLESDSLTTSPAGEESNQSEAESHGEGQFPPNG